MQCRICKEDKKLIKCHILPEAIHKNIYGGMAKEVAIDQHPKKIQIGYYDQNLACESCENKFHIYDDYFIKFYRDQFGKNYTEISAKNGKLQAHRYENFKFNLLYGFFIYHLLRASLTDLDFYQEVKIGDKYNELLIRSLLKNELPTSNCGIELVFSTYDENIRAQIPPCRKKLDNGINAYVFIFPGGVKVCYKVDSRPWRHNSIALKPTSTELIIPVLPMEKIFDELHKADSQKK